MRRKHFLWLIALGLGIANLVVMFGPSLVNSQIPPKATDKAHHQDIKSYPTVDYQSDRTSLTPEEAETERKKASFYDNQGFVMVNPNLEDSGVGRLIERPTPEAFPVEESDLIVVGNVLDAKAKLSNDKSGIFGEFNVKILETEKDDEARPNKSGRISVDRAGGIVRYPNGKSITYFVEGEDLPKPGGTYLLFLKHDDVGSNYHIIRVFELTDSSFDSLDSAVSLESTGVTTRDALLSRVKAKVNDARRRRNQ